MKRRAIPDNMPAKNGNGHANGHSNGNANGNGFPRYNGNGHNGHVFGSSYEGVPYEDRPASYHEGTRVWLQGIINGKRPYGQPAYRDHFPEMVFQLRLLGASRTQIAVSLNVTDEQLLLWLNLSHHANHAKTEKPELREAYVRGGELADARVSESLYHRAIGYTHEDEKIMSHKDLGIVRVPTLKHYPPDSAAGVFWLTNRQGARWRNRVTNEMTGPDGSALVPPQLIVTPVAPTEPTKSSKGG